MRLERQPGAGDIAVYVTAANERCQHPRIFKDEGYIPKQPEDTRSELLWNNQYSKEQQLPADGAKSP